jgi:hypothetical protein
MSDGALLWDINDQEAAALGKAIAPFGKYIPVNAEVGGVALEIGNLAKTISDVFAQRFMLERMILMNQQQPQAAPPGTPAAASNEPYDLMADRRRAL